MTVARTTTEVLQDHLAKRLAHNIEGDIRDNYADDIIILSSFGTFRGHEGVELSAHKLEEALADATFHYNRTLIEGAYGFLEWSGLASSS